jgi:Antibiotic biosynthesis monooxygenase
MSEIVVVGAFAARPGKEAEAAEAFRALMEPTHGEDGCILCALHQGADDPRRLAFAEGWAWRDAQGVARGPHRRFAGLVVGEELGVARHTSRGEARVPR